MYHNIQINENIIWQDEIISSCYVEIVDVSINLLSTLNAIYILKVYKSKVICNEHPEWTIMPNEIMKASQLVFDASFTQGDLFLKVSEALKSKLLEINPTWSEYNIIIE